MKEIRAYVLDELCNEHKQIYLRTNNGTELSIKEKNGVTIILFPYGNDVKDVEIFGHLQKGIAVMEQK